MKLLNIVLTLTLVYKFLQDERTKSYEDYLAKRSTQQPLEQPKQSRPYEGSLEESVPTTCSCINNCRCIKPVYSNGRYKITVDDNGIITSTSSNPSKYKLTAQDIAEGYRTNPFRNYNI